MNLATLSVKTAGPDAAPGGTLFFLSGFPDTHNTFMDTLVPELSENHRCVVACLPDYDRSSLQAFLGYDGREIVARLGRTLDAHAKDGPVTLVLHDWGSVYGLAWYAADPANAARVTRIVCLDVFMTSGLRETTRGSSRALFWMVLYQAWLAATFAVGRVLPPAGDLLLFLMHVLKLSPDLDPPPPGTLCPPRGPRWFMAYPYVHEWADKLRGRRRPRVDVAALPPVLYAYGTRKRAMFHSPVAVARLASDPRNKVLAYDCGHWVQHAKARELGREIRAFLA